MERLRSKRHFKWGIVLTVCACLLMGTSVSANPTDRVAGVDSGMVNIKDYGAVGDGVANDSPAIQAAIDAVAQDGGIVFIPGGLYRMAAGVNVPSGVTVQGTLGAATGPWQQYLDTQDKELYDWNNPTVPYLGWPEATGTDWIDRRLFQGSWILVDHDAGNVDGAPTFRIQGNTTVKMLGFVHAALAPVTDQVVPVPPAIAFNSSRSLPMTRDGVVIEDITLANPYIGIAVAAGTAVEDYYLGHPVSDATVSMGRARIHNIMGGPLYKGIMIKGALDTVDMMNIQFNYSNYSGPYVTYRTRNCTDLEIARGDGITVTGMLSFGAKYGIVTRPAFNDRHASLRATNLNLEAQIPMSLRAGGQYEVTNSYLMSMNFVDYVVDHNYKCLEIVADPDCPHQPHYLFSNMFMQNTIMRSDVPNYIVDVEINNATTNGVVSIADSKLYGWDGSGNYSAIRYHRNGGGAQQLMLNNVDFVNANHPGDLITYSGDQMRAGDVHFAACRFPTSIMGTDKSDAKLWFSDCTIYAADGVNTYWNRH